MEAKKYEVKASEENPALLIILIDQSSSMDRILVIDEKSRKYSISRMVKIMADNVLYEILTKNMEGESFTEKIHIAIIGYGLTVHSSIYNVNLEEYPIGVQRLDEVSQKTEPPPSPDERFPRSNLSWVEERADGRTPMVAAFEEAKKILENWLPSHMSSNPPIVLNLTDGWPTDDAHYIEMIEQGSLAELSKSVLVSKAEEIKQLETKFGNVIVANGHMSAEATASIAFPVSASEVERINPYALLFFEMSSIIPEPFRILGNKSFNMNLEYNSRMFLFNGNAADFINFFRFGSSAGGGI